VVPPGVHSTSDTRAKALNEKKERKKKEKKQKRKEKRNV
jgi:hypothetical protein